MTAAVIGIALALPTGLHVLLDNAQQLSGGWQEATQISLFLKTDTTDLQARKLINRLRKLPEIKGVKYINRQQALTEFKALSGDRKSTRLNSSHIPLSRMPSSA